jgi:hypothetical protein
MKKMKKSRVPLATPHTLDPSPLKLSLTLRERIAQFVEKIGDATFRVRIAIQSSCLQNGGISRGFQCKLQRAALDPQRYLTSVLAKIGQTPQVRTRAVPAQQLEKEDAEES